MHCRNNLRPALAAAVLLAASATVTGAAPVSRGDIIAATCVTCHHPANQHIPPLANTSAALIAAQAQTSNTLMHRLAAGLSEEDIEAVADALARSHGDAP